MKYTYHGRFAAFKNAAGDRVAPWDEPTNIWYTVQITVYQAGRAWYAGAIVLADEPIRAASKAVWDLSHHWGPADESPWDLPGLSVGPGAVWPLGDEFVVARVRRSTAAEEAALRRRLDLRAWAAGGGSDNPDNPDESEELPF